MTVQHQSGLRDTNLDERSVSDFLQANPDFFSRNQDLLEAMVLTQPNGKVTSLLERQVKLLRDKNRQLKRKLDGFMRIAKDNDRLSGLLHGLTLGLLEADSFAEVLAVLNDRLMGAFELDACSLDVFIPQEHLGAGESFDGFAVRWTAPDSADLEPFRLPLSRRSPVCGRLTPAQANYLFAERGAEVASAALLPLPQEGSSAAEVVGLLAMGSDDPQRFHPDMSTVFLGYLAQLLGLKLRLSRN